MFQPSLPKGRYFIAILYSAVFRTGHCLLFSFARGSRCLICRKTRKHHRHSAYGEQLTLHYTCRRRLSHFEKAFAQTLLSRSLEWSRLILESGTATEERMQPLRFDPVSYLSGGRRVFLISGEIHYFRAPRDAWRDRLQKLKDAGGNCVATYLPWLIHEPQEGAFNFKGQFDPEPFFELCNEIGLWIIARPGPYQYSEMVCDGLPVWLCENYPQLRAKRVDGADIRYSSISYMHPLFIEKARRWFNAVLPKIVPHQVTRGGAVAAVQFDNELMGIHDWFGDLDHNRETFGIGQENGRWPDFLKQRYHTPQQAAVAYGMSVGGWSEILPKRDTDGKPEGRRLVKDYQDCYFKQVAEYARTLVGWMRQQEIDVPVVHNAGSPKMDAYFLETIESLGKDFVLGSDHYYTLAPSWAQNNPTPQYGANCFASLEMLRILGMPPSVFEMPGGSLSDFPPFFAHDAACCYLMHVGLGVKGFNYYIFCGGVNPPDSGTTGDLYDYGAAIGPFGDIRPVYGVQQNLARFLKQNEWLASADAVSDCLVGFDFEITRAQRYAGDSAGLLSNATQTWDFVRSGLLLTAFAAGISPAFVDLRQPLLPTAKPLVLASWDSMSRRLQQNLVDYLSAGGRLLLVGVVPRLDEQLNACTLLADAIGPCIQLPDTARLHRFDISGTGNVYTTKAHWSFTRRPADATVTARQVRGEASEVGWRRTLPGGGVVSVLGILWDYASRDHESMLRNALAELGWERNVESSNQNVWLTIRTDGRRSMVFAHNLFSSPLLTSIRYKDPVTTEWVETGEQHLPGMSVRVLANGRLSDPLSGGA